MHLIQGSGVKYTKKFALPKKDGLQAINKYRSLHKDNVESTVCLATYYEVHRNNYDSALYYFDQAIDLDPENVYFLFSRGILSFKNKRTDRSIEDFKACVNHKPGWPDAWLNLGASYLNNGNADSSIAAFNKAVQLNPKHKKSLFLYG